MAKRHYGDDVKAESLAALDANGGNVAKTARVLGVPRATLQEWRDGKVPDQVPEIRQQKKADLADRLETIAHKLVDAVEGKIPEATLQQVTTSLGITVDKMQLLRDKPTAINRELGLTEDERAARIAEILDRGRSRSGAALPHGGGAGGTGEAPRPVAN